MLQDKSRSSVLSRQVSVFSGQVIAISGQQIAYSDEGMGNIRSSDSTHKDELRLNEITVELFEG